MSNAHQPPEFLPCPTPAPSETTSLGFDIFTHIISCLDTRSALQFAATHKEVYRSAVKHALRSVELDRLTQILGLSTFVSSRPEYGESLIELRLRMSWDGQELHVNEAHESLCNLLEHSPHLKHLSMLSADYVLRMDGSRVARTIGALTELSSLELLGAANYTYEVFLPGLCNTRLHNFAISFPDLSIDPHQLLSSLLPMRDLEELTIMDSQQLFRGTIAVDLQDHFLIRTVADAEESPHISRWENVRHISLLSGTITFPDYIRAFPSVRSLYLTDTELFKDAKMEGPYDISDPQWQSLDCIRVGSMGWGSDGFSCRVKWLDFDHPMFGINSPPVTSALKLIRNTKPVIISMSMGSNIGPQFWGLFVSTIPYVKYLEFELDDSTSMGTWIDEIMPILAKLELVCIRFYVGPSAIAPRTCERAPPDQLVLGSLPTILMQGISSLRYIACRGHRQTRRELWEHKSCTVERFVRTRNVYMPSQQPIRRSDEEHDWWKVVGSGTSRRLEPIPLEVGELVRKNLHAMDYEDLQKLDASSVF